MCIENGRTGVMIRIAEGVAIGSSSHRRVVVCGVLERRKPSASALHVPEGAKQRGSQGQA